MARRSGRAGEQSVGAQQVLPAVTSRRPPAWRSPRFGVGILLVVGSVALGSWALDRAASGEQMWVARHDLAPGDPVSSEDLRSVAVAWEGDEGVYLTAADVVPGSVAVSFVGAGELVPSAALGVAADVDGRPVTVPVPTGVVVEPGVLVDLWSLPRPGEGEPQQIADGAQVLGVEEDSGLLRSGSGRVARVLVDPAVVPAVLAVQADGGAVTLVERPGS
ncbi:hypothetical protein [Litorihabitans aurantiacus]|uniref:hypothetical protein n=1 Tax=Litorihabitans aurantiacus TaxID=1930061 RepID=UPI0024E0FFA2|nr:hypothetical protein [Litorihabitans aurantiacus]